MYAFFDFIIQNNRVSLPENGKGALFLCKRKDGIGENMKKRKLNVLISGMSVLLAVQTPGVIWAESLEGTEQQMVQEVSEESLLPENNAGTEEEKIESEVQEVEKIEEDIPEQILEGTERRL